MADIFGGSRKISLCRELTKLNEEILRTTIAGAIKEYSQKEPRGEYVLIVEGADESFVRNDAEDLSRLSPEEHVKKYICDGMAKMDAIKKAAKERGVPKSELYKQLVDIEF